MASKSKKNSNDGAGLDLEAILDAALKDGSDSKKKSSKSKKNSTDNLLDEAAKILGGAGLDLNSILDAAFKEEPKKSSKTKNSTKGGLLDEAAKVLSGSGLDLESILDAAMGTSSSKKKSSSSSSKKKSSEADSIFDLLMGEEAYYPQISEKTYWAAREKFQKNIPEKVTASTLTNATGLKADTVKSTVLPALEAMCLTKNGKPTSRMKAWVNDDKYEATCAQIREDLYPSSLKKLPFNTQTQQNAVVSWFKKNANVSEATAKKMLAVFLLMSAPKLKEAKKSDSKSGTSTKKTTSAKKTSPEVVVDSVKVTTKSGKSTITVKVIADEGISKKALAEKLSAAAADAYSQMK